MLKFVLFYILAGVGYWAAMMCDIRRGTFPDKEFSKDYAERRAIYGKHAWAYAAGVATGVMLFWPCLAWVEIRRVVRKKTTTKRNES